MLAVATARADEAPLVHPIYAHLPDAPENDSARQLFTAAATRYNLRPVEVVDVPAPAEPHAPTDVRMGILNAQKLAFSESQHDLDAAAAEVATTGGAGLTAAELGDLYLFRAMAVARADWNAQPTAAPTDARTKAFDDYLRAATLAPNRTLNERELPPQVVADFKRAQEIVRKRPLGTLIVKGPADAQIALDGGALMPVAGGVTIHDVSFGEHLIRVEQIGYAPWGTIVPFGQPSVEIDVPTRAALTLDDATAAAHARRMGARFALVGAAKGGPGAPVEISLVDSGSGARRDSALVPTTGEAGQIDAAVMRLDEEARRVMLEQQTAGGGVAPPPVAADPGASALGPPLLLTPASNRVRFSDDPAAWARDHWPLLTAIGVVAVTAIVLTAAVSSDR
ncbi:MAG TPA: hypothetical protein VLA79_14400 [Polyangia bacterium]|nr:hypothetical protein [Polyangia bacterium]